MTILLEIIKVIEAVFENLDLKKEIFARLDKICKPSALLCSNTSALSIDQVITKFNCILSSCLN